jgi:Holliday junction resolvase RusA-like endonuclease
MRIILNLPPKPKQSFKYTRAGIKYTDSKVKSYTNDLRSLILNAISKDFIRFEKGLKVDYIFTFESPQSMPKKIGIGAYKIKKPDLDNLQKMVNDAMNGLIFRDDSQICEITAKKIYGNPKIELTFTEVENGW